MAEPWVTPVSIVIVFLIFVLVTSIILKTTLGNRFLDKGVEAYVSISNGPKRK